MLSGQMSRELIPLRTRVRNARLYILCENLSRKASDS